MSTVGVANSLPVYSYQYSLPPQFSAAPPAIVVPPAEPPKLLNPSSLGGSLPREKEGEKVGASPKMARVRVFTTPPVLDEGAKAALVKILAQNKGP